MSFDFEKLEVYQEAVDFATEIYHLSQKFPKVKLFGLTAQLRRAGVSVGLNIAESSGRLKKEFKQFLRVARASIYECIAILQISVRQRYADRGDYEQLYARGERLAKRINALINSLQLL
jgi:four helix bundle protein